MRVEFQRTQVEFPSAELGYLRDSTDALADVDELRRRITADGYLLLRGLIDRGAVLEARRVVLEHLREQDALVEGTPLMEGVMPRDGRSVGMKRGRLPAGSPARARSTGAVLVLSPSLWGGAGERSPTSGCVRWATSSSPARTWTWCTWAAAASA